MPHRQPMQTHWITIGKQNKNEMSLIELKQDETKKKQTQNQHETNTKPKRREMKPR